ncbi:hypothetical protein GALMADRAFT_143157 [Galerina marginata CBS 339.88]|uniref:Uncharacterized protein n=1 Tax=Galerina marginata (strain CBS 339.88) TaxID=685588 RepID=A0A067SX86_GALM3|nr:hypothetical protein GALMADRAFT_143157 [Galerina marginata CBS 339.88]
MVDADKNFVIRVDKLARVANPVFNTYINGEYLATIGSQSPLVTPANPPTIDVFIQPLGLLITLTVFDNAKIGDVEKFVQEMRNSGKASFDLNADGTEGETRANGGQSSMPGTGLRPQDAKLMGGFDLDGDGNEGAAILH